MGALQIGGLRNDNDLRPTLWADDDDEVLLQRNEEGRKPPLFGRKKRIAEGAARRFSIAVTHGLAGNLANDDDNDNSNEIR